MMTSGKKEALKVSQVAQPSDEADKQKCRLLQTQKAMSLHGCCCERLSKPQSKTPAADTASINQVGQQLKQACPMLAQTESDPAATLSHEQFPEKACFPDHLTYTFAGSC